MSDIVRHYDASKNPGTEAAPALPEHVQRDVDASPMYRKTAKPSEAKTAARAEPPAKAAKET
jgi:hypothetical protein